MNAEHWQQVKTVFHDASELAPAERSAFLEVACAGNAELRREVESLLAADEPEDEFLAQPLLARSQTRETPTAKLQTGQMIGDYRIERLLGAGGMGVVYLARDTQLERPAALKLLRTSLTQDATRLRRFRQEARAASALNHPNILTIYEVGQAEATTSSSHFIAAEFVDGQTLREHCKSGQLTLGAALDLLIQVASALAAAHEAGIIHRDIKPENIMLRRDGLAKVLDFGLAKLTEHALRSTVLVSTASSALSSKRNGADSGNVRTQPGIVMGTVRYMSPEQARGLDVDGRSDLFSLGVVMYELLAGCAPFVGDTTADVLAALLNGEPRPLDRYDVMLPASLQRIINRALAKSTAERYQSAREIGDELKQLKDELSFAARLKGRAGTEEDLLMMKIGTATDGHEQTTFRTLPAATPGGAPQTPDAVAVPTLATRQINTLASSSLVTMRGWLRRYGKLAATVTLALALAASLFMWGRRLITPRADAIESIAVLPFVNENADPQTEYLPDGITESLIESLSRLPGLDVMARATVFTYKGREEDPRQVGAALKVRAVLTGRVRREAARLVIRVELADTADGARLWGEKYERRLDELQTLQEEITREISEALRLRLSGDTQQQIAKRRAVNSEAYQRYMLGRHLYNQGTQPGRVKGLEHYRQAIALDPQFALAHASAAHAYAVLSSQYLSPSEAIPQARQAALKALELDETLAEAHFALALVKWWGDWDWTEAEREFKRALALNPNLISGHVSYAHLLSQQGRFDEALRETRRVETLDPLGTANTYTDDRVFYYSRQYDRAIEQSRRRLDLNPDNLGPRLFLGMALSQKGAHEEALREIQQVVTRNASPSYRSTLAYVQACAGHRNEARKAVQELEQMSILEHVSPLYIARVYVGLGETEQAITLLQKGLLQRSDHLLSLGADPIYDPLRKDPRFVEILKAIGLAK